MFFGFSKFVSFVGLYLDMFHDSCLIVVVFVSIFVLFCVFSVFFFNGGGYLNLVGAGERLIEFWWTMLPGLVLSSLVAPSLYGLYYLDVGGESVSNDVINIVAKQWYWNYNVVYSFFRGGESLGSYNQLLCFSSYYDYLMLKGFRYLEVDVPLLLYVGGVFRLLFSSSDVMHSYCIPELAVKVDCVPGRYNQGFLSVQISGKFFGSCVEMCGMGHSVMPVCVEVLGI